MLDDDIHIAELVRVVLEDAGYQVQTAARGRTALDLARKERPVAFLDGGSTLYAELPVAPLGRAQAELTADRAGLLVSQDLGISIDANLGLTAGPSRLQHEMSRDAFMEQARTYQDATGLEAIGKVLIFVLMSSTYTHPMPVHRTQELERWYLSGAYDRIMKGDYSRTKAA